MSKNVSMPLGKFGDMGALVESDESGTFLKFFSIQEESKSKAIDIRVRIDLVTLLERIRDRGLEIETLNLWEHGSIEDKATDKVKDTELNKLEPDVLMRIMLDQQYNYWYDPCGKSGHTLDAVLTGRSRKIMKLLFVKLTGNNP